MSELMSEFETKKIQILEQLQGLCAHCACGNLEHRCVVREIALRVESIRGVPLMVNSEFKGVLWQN